MHYKVNGNLLKDSFAVPAIIADKHLRLAGGEQIKVLLLILRNSDKSLSVGEIAKALKYTESDVEDCLQYWILTGVISEEEGESEAPKKYIPKTDTQKKPSPPPAPSVPAAPVIEYSRPGQEEIATRMSESKEIADLFSELQVIMGKTIGYDGQCTFLLLHDRFGLPPEVIYMLADYCVKIGKPGYSYIEAVGKSWAEAEIDTIDKAAEKIASLDETDKFWKRFILAAGLNNPKPTQKQIAYIEKWTVKQNMSFDLIFTAYEEMAEHTGKLSFAYMDKILDGWYAAGYKTKQDIENAKKVKTEVKAPGGASSASYNLGTFAADNITNKPKYKRKKK